jgi:hypothetical protein
MAPAALRATLSDAFQDAISRGTFLALLFHPFLADREDRLGAMRDVLGELRALVDEQVAWCAPMREIAAWVRQQPDAGSWAVRLDPD